jgi:hypothetical protein
MLVVPDCPSQWLQSEIPQEPQDVVIQTAFVVR